MSDYIHAVCVVMGGGGVVIVDESKQRDGRQETEPFHFGFGVCTFYGYCIVVYMLYIQASRSAV